MVAILIDTNLLVYAHDRGNFSKQAQAIQVLDMLHDTGQGRLSVQSLSEFFNATTRGQSHILSIEEAAIQTERLALSFPVFQLTTPVVLEAVRGVRQHRLSYYDAQIWAAARLNQISVIFSEDFSSGSSLDGVRFVDPFSETFLIESWV